MCLPTHPRVFARFGKTKVEIRVEKGNFRGDFEGVGPCLGISHPTHPHLGKISQKKGFFLPSLNRVEKCQTFYTDQNMAFDIFKKSFTTYDYTYGATGALNWWWGSDYCKTNDELLHHLPFTWKIDLSKYFIIFPISQWGSRDVWCEQLVASKTISEARTESNWEVSLSQKNFFTLCLYRPGWTLGSFLVNQYQVVKYELVQWEAY